MIERVIILLAMLAVAGLPTRGLGQSTNVVAEAKEEATNRRSLKELAAKTYESLGTTATNAVDWLKRDWEKIGAWKYKITTVAVSDTSDAALESKLNDLGKEGWECFWVRQTRGGLTLFFKKPEKGIIAEALKHRP
jgi:hypothetical protein